MMKQVSDLNLESPEQVKRLQEEIGRLKEKNRRLERNERQ